MKKLQSVLEKWGYYLLALLCAAVILLSALWTKKMKEQPPADAPVLVDESQRLNGTTPLPPPACTPPGEFLRGYSEAPVYFPETGVWQSHPGVDFALESGVPVPAVQGGRVEIGDGALTVTGENGDAIRYRGCGEYLVRTGQTVKAGDALGYSGGTVPYEGAGHICLTWLQYGTPYDPGIRE